MNIGQAAQQSGVSAKMIRHYESIGLVSEARRTDAGYRIYDANDIHTLRFIRRARHLGFTIKQIAQLLGLWRISELDQKIDELQAMRRTLHQLVEHCYGDRRPDCPILDDLAGEMK
jgi:MerR family copper efflux transcriptional regulator